MLDDCAGAGEGEGAGEEADGVFSVDCGVEDVAEADETPPPSFASLRMRIWSIVSGGEGIRPCIGELTLSASLWASDMFGDDYLRRF
jgi:hypothetical protein